MNARNLLNLALLVLACTLVALILLRPGLQESGPGQPLTTIDAQTVRSISLLRASAEPLVFRKFIDDWRIDGSPALPADDFQVHTVLALLDAASVRSYPDDELHDLTALGLDPPQASVRFDDTLIDIGNTDALENLRYVRIGDTVHLVQDRFQHLLNAGFGNFVQRALLPDHSAITRLELPGFSLEQTDGVHWDLQPERPEISADTIDALVAAWARTSALYVRRMQDGAGTAEAADTILVTQGDTRPVEFRILTRSPDLILARPEWHIQYHLPAESAVELLTLPEQPVADVAESMPEIAAPGLPDIPVTDPALLEPQP